MRDAIKGCDGVFHAASPITDDPVELQAYLLSLSRFPLTESAILFSYSLFSRRTKVSSAFFLNLIHSDRTFKILLSFYRSSRKICHPVPRWLVPSSLKAKLQSTVFRPNLQDPSLSLPSHYVIYPKKPSSQILVVLNKPSRSSFSPLPFSLLFILNKRCNPVSFLSLIPRKASYYCLSKHTFILPFPLSLFLIYPEQRQLSLSLSLAPPIKHRQPAFFIHFIQSDQTVNILSLSLSVILSSGCNPVSLFLRSKTSLVWRFSSLFHSISLSLSLSLSHVHPKQWLP